MLVDTLYLQMPRLQVQHYAIPLWTVAISISHVSCCRSGGTSSPLLKGRTSVQAVKPAGRPELNPSAVDKTAVLDVVDDVGNSEAAEACTPSAASDSFFIRRPGGIFPAISREDCRL